MHVRPEQVVEIAFDGVQRSTRYPGGVALRFARVLRYRDDKPAEEIDTIETVRSVGGLPAAVTLPLAHACVTRSCTRLSCGMSTTRATTRQPAAARRRAREREILAATRRLFDETGVRDAQIEDIAKAVGVNRAIIYRHFSGKEELFALTLVSYLEELEGRLTAATRGKRTPDVAPGRR